MLRKIVVMLGWSVLFYFGSAFVLGFCSGTLFFILAMGGVQTSSIEHLAGAIGLLGVLLPALFGLAGLLLGAFGRLPGTRMVSTAAHSDRLELTILLPDWIEEFLHDRSQVLQTMQDRMQLVIDLARQNIRRKTGGPFGAAVFDEAGGLVALGVNIVERSNCSILHAEMVAIALAQKRLGRYDLSDGGKICYELVTAAEPCAMCFGAIPWAGLSRVVCGARDADVRSIGFDEGPKLPDWSAALEARGIEVVRDLLRDESISVLREYAGTGGVIYNPGPCKKSGT